MGLGSRLSSTPTRLQALAAAAVFGILYFLVARLSNELVGDGSVAVVWLPSGLYLGALLVADRRMWAELVCAALAASFGAYYSEGSAIDVSVAFAVPSAAEGLLAALLVRRLADDRFALRRARDVAALVLGGAVLANALTALGAAAAARQAFAADFADSWLRWWSADGLGMLAVAPLIAAFATESWPRLRNKERSYALLVVGGLAAACLVLATAEPWAAAAVIASALVVPFLLWAGWRWGAGPVALGALVLAGAVAYFAGSDSQALAFTDALSTDVLVVQAALAVVLAASLIFAAAATERARGEEALAAARRRMQRLIESVPDAYLSLSDEGLVVEWGPRAETMFGLSRDAALGRSLAEATGLGPGAAGSHAEPVKARRASGEEIPVELTVSPACDGEVKGQHVFIRDLTEREGLRAELAGVREELERRSTALAEATARIEQLSADLVATGEQRDLTARERDQLRQELTDMTAQRERTRSELQQLTRERDELQGKLREIQVELAQSAERAERLGRELDDAKQQIGQIQRELDLAREQAAQTQRELESERAGHARAREELVSISEERTELTAERGNLRTQLERLESAREQAELAVRESADRFEAERQGLERARDAAARQLAEAERERRLLASNAREVVARYSADGTCLYVSPACSALLGYDPAELIGEPGVDLLHPDDRPLLQAARAKAGTSQFDARLQHKDGRDVWVEVSVRAVREPESGRLIELEANIRDAAERRAVEERRRATQARIDTVFAESPIGMALLALDGGFERVNPALSRLSGYSREQLETAGLGTIVHPEDMDACDTSLRRLASRERTALQAQLRLLHADGHLVPVSVSFAAVPNNAGDAAQIVAQIQDLSETARAKQELHRLTEQDPLTGLFSRARFEEQLRSELAASGRYGTGGAVLVADLDAFIDVNGVLGRPAADELLGRIGDALRQRLRATDIVARTGGDEFGILLPRADESKAREVASALLAAVRDVAAAELRDTPIALSASIGIAIFGERDSVGAEELLVEAEIAVQDAKHAGGNRAAVYDPASDRPAAMRDRLAWGERIRAALREDRLVLHAQPVVSLNGPTPPRHELVLQMLGENGELIPPAAFLPVAERIGLAGEIDRWLLRRAIAALADQQHAGADLHIEVGLSSRSVEDQALPAFVSDELEKAGAKPNGLCVTIAEGALMGSSDRAGLFVRRLADLGLEVGLDRFGSGLGSFRHVEHMPAAYIKVDAALVDSLKTSESARLVLGSIAQIARGLGRRTAARSVPDEQTLTLVRSAGIDYAQGQAVAPTRPLDELALGRASAPAEQT